MTSGSTAESPSKLDKLRWELVQENSAFAQALQEQQHIQQQIILQKFQDQLNYTLQRVCEAYSLNDGEGKTPLEGSIPLTGEQNLARSETAVTPDWSPDASVDNQGGPVISVNSTINRTPHNTEDSWRERLTIKMTTGELNLPYELCHGHVTSAAAALEKSRKFQWGIQMLICASGVMLGIQSNQRALNLSEGRDPTSTVVDLLFTGTFCFELLVRVLANGLFFLSPNNPETCWNAFDTLVVLADLVEKGLEVFLSTTILSLSTGRLLRMMRFVRLIRVLRVLRFFQDLRVMILSIMGSMRPLLFAMLLLGIIIYTVAVALLHFVTDELLRLQQAGEEGSPTFLALSKSFGSLGKAAYTLFLSISGGEDWGEVSAPLWEISPLLGSCFLMYVCFSMFCVLNIITGIFIEEANIKTCQDEDHMLVRELDKRRRFIAEAKRFFERADKDGSGQLTWPEFQEILENVRMQKLLERLGIDVQACGARNVFEMFDFDGNGVIEVTEFTSGLKRLRGGARSIEIAGMRFEQQKLLGEVAALSRTRAEFSEDLIGRETHGRATTNPKPSKRGPAFRSFVPASWQLGQKSYGHPQCQRRRRGSLARAPCSR